MIMRRSALVILLVLILAITSGCWDRREIEDRGYVIGMAIDKATGEQTEIQDTPQTAGQQKYRLTVELPKFRRTEGKKEVASAESHLIWSVEGESIFAMIRAINTKTYFGMYFEDVQSLIFSEAIAQEGIGDLLDFFLRDAEIRRKVKLFVAPNRAEDILKAKLQVEELNSDFIAKMTRNEDRSPYFNGKAELGEVAEAMRDNRSFLIPLVMVEGKEIKLARNAVFNKQKKMIGVLDEYEVNGTKILHKRLKQGVIVVENPANSHKIAVFELYRADIKITPHLEGADLRFSLEAKLEGTLGENAEMRQNNLDPKFIKALEAAIEAEYTRLVQLSYTKQQFLKVEVCQLGKLVYNKYPQYWKQIKNHWEEEIFPSARLDTKITVNIRSPVLKD